MAGNRFIQDDKVALFNKKLELLVQNLQTSYKNPNLRTQEDLLEEFIKNLNDFYKTFDKPMLDPDVIAQIRVDGLPNPERYDKLWNQILNDLTVLFNELENTEGYALANFNFIVTENNRLVSRLKAVDSKVGDYVLYSLSPDKRLLFFKDSFNDISKVDTGSGLLNNEECSVNQTEGVVTLPINPGTDPIVLVKEDPIINPNSNGSIGNNQEIGSPYNGNLAALIDNNVDSWFEYEKVIGKTSTDKDALVLDLTINLGEEKVINHININPNNFGTKTVIKIKAIETSLDGQVYTSIKDDIPIAGFSTEDEENLFSLAPSTSKFAGQGLYTFTPRKVRYIHFVFEQDEAYLIETTTGTKLRYAIGIRDIDIKSYDYLNKGEIVSTRYESLSEIQKVVLDTNQNPSQLSELANIDYFISPDNGGSWIALQPQNIDGITGVKSKPEILNFNLSVVDGLSTAVPVKSIRLKAVMTRTDDAFVDGASSFSKEIVSASEIQNIPEAPPFSIELENPPVDQTVIVVDPLFGSRGIPEAAYILGHGKDKIDNRKYRLPFLTFPQTFKKVSDAVTPVPTWHLEQVSASEYLHVEVGGLEWTHATQKLDDYTLDINNLQNFMVFVFNPNDRILEFGNSISNTYAPPADQPISVYFEPERLFPSAEEDEHLAKLEFSTSSNKNDLILKRYDELTTVTESLPRKATVIRLTNQNLTSTAIIALVLNGQGFDATAKDFLNGKDELTTSTSWSIDITAGIIYLAAPLSAILDLSVTYDYQPVTVLTTDDWEWGTTSLLKDSIQIKESSWRTYSVSENLPKTTGVKVLDLSQMSAADDTLKLEVKLNGATLATTDEDHPFVKEVAFINGIQELGGAFVQATEQIPSSIAPVANVASFDLKENISTLTAEHGVSFSDTALFATAVGSPAAVTSTGEYYVERASAELDYGKVYFYTTSAVASPGKVTYYYASDTYKNNGLYSVNYKLGQIHSQREVNPDNDSDYEITATYEYSNFQAEYKIARLVDQDSYEVDITNQTVTFTDKEILQHMQIPHQSFGNRSPVYLVNYDYVDVTRENIDELRDKFTPVLKDYSLRILTKK